EDGRPDVVVTNSSSDTVSAFLNIATFPVFPLSVSLAGTGTGTVTSTPAGINCGNTCSASFVTGVAVTLAAAASAGSVFAGWSGACSGTASCVATISAAAATTSNIRLLYAILLPMMGLAFTIGLRSQTRYQKLSTALLRCMTCVVLICQPACGGGSSGGANTGTPPGSYTITVTGMSGSSLKHSATLMLKIQ